MKNILFLTSLIAVVLATGCKKPAEKPAAQSTGSPAQQVDKAQTAIKETGHQMPDYTFAQKTDFIAMMHTHLADLNRGLDEFAATIATSSDAVQKEAAPKLAGLRAQATLLDKQLGAVTNATSSTWSVFKADSERAYSALKDDVAQSRDWISTKLTS